MSQLQLLLKDVVKNSILHIIVGVITNALLTLDLSW